MLEVISNTIWSNFTFIAMLAIGIYFTLRLKLFQIFKQSTIWKCVFQGASSSSGISSFSAFCTAMAQRIGIGNIAGVGIAIYFGGPGVLFWMRIIGFS